MSQALKAVVCSKCGSNRTCKSGLRDLSDGSKNQRFLCRNCGYRFSNGHVSSKTNRNIVSSNQLCAIIKKKKLDTQAEKTVCAGEIDQKQHGLIVEFQWKMKKRNKADKTIENRTLYLSRLVKLGADLMNPETVETVFATEEWPTAAKYNAVKAYIAFTKAYKVDWEPIKINYEPKEVFIPLEEEIDLLINACSKVTATFCQVIKDTAARVGEVRRIEWTDINEKDHTIAINHPEKGSKTRTIKVKEKTISMVKDLKKNHGNYVFNPTFTSQRKTFNLMRAKMARITNNPRLLKIHFHILRHWKASNEYERTGDIYTVKHLLGHKSISNTDRYQHGTFSNDDYVTKRPQTSLEEDTLISAGFEFVRFDQKENVPIYRKRK